MLHIGNRNLLRVSRLVDFGAYLASEKGEILLPGKYLPADTAPGDDLEVFVHTDSEDRLIATTRFPKAVVGEFAALTVRDVTRFGAFLDWGLEKDLFVPRQLQRETMLRGQTHVVYICLDEVSGRVIASGKLKRFFDADTQNLQIGQKVTLLIYERSELGFGAVIDGRYSGLLYHNEIFEFLRIGDTRDGYVKQVRENGKVDLALQPPGYQALMDESQHLILDALRRAGGFLPLTVKSDPEDIYHEFGISKKAFKKLIGGLYRERQISITEDGIRILE